MTRMITAMFDSRAEADAAVDRLVSEIGLARTAVQVHGGEAAATSRPATTTAAADEGIGFWSALRDLFVPDEDRPTYAEGLRRGSFVVSAEVPDSDLDRAMDVLEAHGAVDLDSREAQWRASGWSGSEPDAKGTSGMGTSGVGATGTVASLPTSPEIGVAGTTREPVIERPGGAGGDFTTNPAPGMMDTGPDTTRRAQDSGMVTSGRTGMSSASATATSTAGMSSIAGAGMAGTAARGSMATGKEEVIPVVEETIRVGKRDVERGRVRVRSYIVERPVNESVTLREEHVDVQRRKVDRPVGAGDDLFRERTIEAVERGEEAVVAKEARVTEEVVLRKDATERTETVQDTVRRTEVKVEDDTVTGAKGTTTDRLGTRHPSSAAAGMSSAPDGAPGNPPGTMASRAVDKTLGTNISGANPEGENITGKNKTSKP